MMNVVSNVGLGVRLDRILRAGRRVLVNRVYGSCVYPVEQRLRTVPNPLLRRALARTTPADMAPHVETLRRDGVVILPGFLSGERLAACQSSFARLMEIVQTGPPAADKPMPWRYVGAEYRDHEFRNPAADYTYACHTFQHDRALLDVVLDEFLLGIVARYFNRTFKLCETGASRYYPMAPRDFSSWQWHHDGLGPRINIMTLFTDVGPGDQYMSYLKGTHPLRHPFGIHNGKTRISRDDVATRYKGYESVNCTGPAGTVIVFDSNGIHRGNRSLGAVRDSTVSCYCPGSTNWPVLVPRAFAESLTPFQRAVLYRNPLARAV